jgi:methionyl-tRNA formyltransferase
MNSAVVFAYHDVGVRCLATLLAHGVEVRLVVTHEDNPRETIWFASVAELARRYDLAVATPADPNGADFVARVGAAEPDFLFSFYYRSMLGPALLAAPRRAALNMHGSLLPKYRGRVPVNWAIIHGERETGATLHHMAAKPDAGPIVDCERVPILPDDTALEVFRKVTCAAEICLDRALPALLAGTASAHPQDLASGSYFGGRKAEDGAIDWSASAQTVHDLVRAVAPPYPGATTVAAGHRLTLLRTLRIAPVREPPGSGPLLFGERGRLFARAGDGTSLRILELELDGNPWPLPLARPGAPRLTPTAPPTVAPPASRPGTA